MMKKKDRYRAMILVLLMITSAGSLAAEENSSFDKRLSVLGGLGISGARGDYPSEYDADVEFSFYPGLRLRLDETFRPDTFILFDFGYLETGFVGYVGPTDSYFYNTYEYLNLDGMFGAQRDQLYFAGGLYFGFGLDAYSYQDYVDAWVDLDSNNDFGLVGEVGIEVLPFLSVGIQGRYGLKSIGSKVDIKNWALLGTFGIHFHRF